jgi:hypothetical protein
MWACSFQSKPTLTECVVRSFGWEQPLPVAANVWLPGLGSLDPPSLVVWVS